VKENRDKPLYKRLQIQGLALYMHFKSQVSSQPFEFAQDSMQGSFRLISEESDTVIEQQMNVMFPVNARKVQEVPYVIEPSKYLSP